MIRKVSGKNKKSECVHIKSSNGNMCYSTKDISNALGGNFQKNSSSSNYSQQFQDIKVEKERENLKFQSQNNEKCNLPFKLSELKNFLDKSYDTTAGSDDIHYQILKHLPSDALETLLNIMNEIWRTGKFPEDWHKAVIIPVPKPGKDKTEATNYRPIALTSCICKTMERMINDRLVWFLESNNLISGNQAGFRKNYSTNDHLVRLESFFRYAFIKKEHCVAILFFCLEKAYDTTWKYGIIKDLHDIGLRGRLPNFILNLLSDRSFNVRIGSTLSDTFEQEQGVPQGSILSPTLFNIKINNIVKCVNDTDSSLYVDDFGIFYKSKNMETIEFRLQRCLNKVETWATENGFKFSKTKTQCVHFCQLRGLHPDPVLNIYGSPIPVVEEAKCLGLLFDKKLSFMPHIKALKAKCLKALDILKVLSNTNWGGDRSVLLNLYRSLVRSKLDYGSIVYGSARKSYLKCLDTIHHQGLRLALGAFRTSSVESLYAESNETSLYTRREKLSLQYTTKLAANPKNPAYNCVFNPKYERFFQREGSLYIACNDRNAFFTSDAVRNYNLWSCQKVCEALTFLLDNIYIRFGSKLYRQIVGIPMGTNCAPLVADLFLFCYERDFMLSLSEENQSGIIEAFNSTSRYLDDLLNIDNNFFDSMVNRIYPSELQLNRPTCQMPRPHFWIYIYLYRMVL